MLNGAKWLIWVLSPIQIKDSLDIILGLDVGKMTFEFKQKLVCKK